VRPGKRAAPLLGALAAIAAARAAGAESPPPLTLTLGEAIRIARARHPSVEAQRGQAMAAGGRHEQALAALLPSLNASLAFVPQTPNLVVTPALQRELLSTAGRDVVIDASGAPVSVACRSPGVGNCIALGPQPISSSLQSFWAAQLGISWTIWDWGRSIYGYRGAFDLARAATVGIRTVERNVVLDVKVAFFGAIAADELVAVAEDAVKTYRAHLVQTQGLHDSGLRTGIDVATAESALASVAIALARARAAQQAARAQLLVALGEDTWRDWKLVADPGAFDLGAEDVRRADAAPEALMDVAFRQRTELQQISLQERGLEAAARAVRGSFLPPLTLSLGPTWAGPDFASLTGNLVINLQLGYPAGGMSPFLVHGQAREADANVIAVRALGRATRDGIRQETVDARALLAAAREEILLARALVEAAARQRSLAEGRYVSGVGNVIELYDALLTDVTARFQMVQARLDLASARARLEHALGDDN